MQLLYLYIPQYGILKDVELNFTGKYQFKFDNETRELKQLPSKNDLGENFFSLEKENGPIKAVSALVGNNGAGKTSVARFIHDIKIQPHLQHICIYMQNDAYKMSYRILPRKVVDEGAYKKLEKAVCAIKENGFKYGASKDDLTAVFKKNHNNEYVLNDKKRGSFSRFVDSVYRLCSNDINSSIIRIDVNVDLRIWHIDTFPLFYITNYYTPMHNVSNWHKRSNMNETVDLSTANLINRDFESVYNSFDINETESARGNQGFFLSKPVNTIVSHEEKELLRQVNFFKEFSDFEDNPFGIKNPKGLIIYPNTRDADELLNRLHNDEALLSTNQILKTLNQILVWYKNEFPRFDRMVVYSFLGTYYLPNYNELKDSDSSREDFSYLNDFFIQVNEQFKERILAELDIDPFLIFCEKMSFYRAKYPLDDSKDMSVFNDEFIYIRSLLNVYKELDIVSKDIKESLFLSLNVDIKTMQKYRKIIQDYFNAVGFNSHFLTISWEPTISSGEYAYLNIFSRLYDSLHMELNRRKELVLFMDEIEITIHPSLQKQLVTNMINFFETFFPEFKVHLIFATHSPILLSDIPQSNTVLLERYTDEKDGMEKVKVRKDEPETFGANIHSLYKNSFLMGDGLIGGFAAHKINKVIKKLEVNDIFSENEKESMLDIINMIGEPVIKSKVKSFYDKKVGTPIISPVEEIELLKARIEELEQMKDQSND